MLRFSLILSAICAGVALIRKFRYTDEPVPQGPMTDAEVEFFLVTAASDFPDASDWRNSITDLCKILRLDHSFSGRADLWEEMGHDDVYEGTAEQNIQLHADVVKKIAEREPITP